MQDYIPREKDINEQIEPVTVKQYDNNSRFLHVKILDKDVDNDLFDLSNCAASLYIQPKENQDPTNIAYVTGEASFDEENGGVATFLLPGSVTQSPGEYECEIHINEGSTGNYPHISTKPFTMTVEKSIRNDQAIMASAQFSALDKMASDVQSINTRMNVIEAMADGGEIPAGTIEAEVIGIRVGWDGTEYESAGDAVRGQIEDIYDFFITSSEISEVLTG